MAGGRDPPPRSPAPAAPRSRGLGLTRWRCGIWWVAELGRSGWVSDAHRAALPPALQAVGTCRIALENVCPVYKAQRLLTVDLTSFPGNPEDCRPSIDSLALRCHSLLPRFRPNRFVQNRGGETPVSPGRSIRWAGLLQPGASSPPSPHEKGIGMRQRRAGGQPSASSSGGIRLHPSLLVAVGRSESKRLRQGGEDERLSYLETLTLAGRKERKGTA